MSQIIDVAGDAARRAGEVILKHFGKLSSVEEKPDRSFVTNADKEAEMAIVAAIRERYPRHAVYGEESGRSEDDSETVWVIDPLDGTHNYIHGLKLFGVSIGVVHKGEFIAGVIYLPTEDRLYAAEAGAGAYRNGEKMSVSSVEELSACSISFDSDLRGKTGIRFRVLERLGQRAFNFRTLGSSAWILACVADGSLDAAVEFDDRPWDFAAGVCLVREAGGVVNRHDGGAMGISDSAYVAGNRAVFSAIQAEIREAAAELARD